jgi:hypothetical protein
MKVKFKLCSGYFNRDHSQVHQLGGSVKIEESRIGDWVIANDEWKQQPLAIEVRSICRMFLSIRNPSFVIHDLFQSPFGMSTNQWA